MSRSGRQRVPWCFWPIALHAFWLLLLTKALVSHVGSFWKLVKLILW